MKKIFKFVVIFLCCVMSMGTVMAKPSYVVSEDGVLIIRTKNEGEILDFDFDSVMPYDKVIVSGPLGGFDFSFLKQAINKCTSIDLTEAQVPFNKIMTQNFMDLEYLEEFKCPKTITLIESQAFNNCPNLRRVVFPKTLKKIEYESFQNCPKLEVEIPSNVEIVKSAFRDSKVTIIDPVTEPGTLVRRFCSWLLDLFRGKDKVR